MNDLIVKKPAQVGASKICRKSDHSHLDDWKWGKHHYTGVKQEWIQVGLINLEWMKRNHIRYLYAKYDVSLDQAGKHVQYHEAV